MTVFSCNSGSPWLRLLVVTKLLTIGALLAALAANLCTGLLTVAAQRAAAPITAQTVFDGD